MKWVRSNNLVVDETGNMVLSFSDDITEYDKNLVLKAPAMLELLSEYVETVESGGYLGKKTYNKVKTLLDKIYND